MGCAADNDMIPLVEFDDNGTLPEEVGEGPCSECPGTTPLLDKLKAPFAPVDVDHEVLPNDPGCNGDPAGPEGF